LHNPDAIKQLIENVRDEAAADSRPSLRIWTVVAIGFAIAIALWQAVFSRWLEKAVQSPEDLTVLSQLGLLATMVLVLCVIYPLIIFPIGSRTRREIYLHTLTAIMLERIKRQ
jgi:hypothetical protein